MKSEKMTLEIEVVSTATTAAEATEEGGRTPVVACCCCAKVPSGKSAEVRPMPCAGCY